LALAVLTLLAERPMHPYEMSLTLKERRKEDSIKLNFGSLYSVVDSLKKRGWIETRGTSPEGRRPERTDYGITDDGRAAMTGWMHELLAEPAKEYPQFEAALSLMLTLPPDEVAEALERRTRRLQERRDHIAGTLVEAENAGMPRVFGVEHHFEVALLDAELRFVNELLVELREGTLSGLAGWRRHNELREAGHPPDQIMSQLATEFPEAFAWIDAVTDDT
jgi:DNA-binding PadR family transcriptional regulator